MESFKNYVYIRDYEVRITECMQAKAYMPIISSEFWTKNLKLNYKAYDIYNVINAKDRLNYFSKFPAKLIKLFPWFRVIYHTEQLKFL